MFYEGLRLWEAHLYVFYVSGRLSGGRMFNHPKSAGGSAKEGPHACGGRGGREGRVGRERVYVFYVSWRLWEAHSYVFSVSWRLWEAHLYVFYVSRSFLGASNVSPT